MGTISEKLTYLNTTKSQLKDMINYGLDDENKITATVGKNLAKISNEYLQESNGLTATYNSQTGALTVSGTATDTNAYFMLKTPFDKPLEVGKNYTLSIKEALTHNMAFDLYDENDASSGLGLNAGQTNVSFSNSSNKLKYRVRFKDLTVGTSYNETLYVQIEEGSSATSFEKYTLSEVFRNYVSSIFNAFLEALRTPDTLFTNLPKKSGTGANITLNDTANAPMRIELGATELTQATTTGKNLLKNWVHENDTTYTTNGITFTKNSDGSITANGTATSSAGYYFVNEASASRKPISAGSYILSGCPSGGSSSTYRLTIGITGVNEYYDNGSGVSVNVTADNTYYCKIQISNGNTVNNLTFYPMLRLSSIADATYEPYTGGIASPNPSYPQDIHTISGSNKVKVEGSNIFDEALLSQETNYNTYNSTTGLWTTNGASAWFLSILYNIASSTTRDITKLIPLGIGTYTIKIYDFVNNTTNANPINYRLFDENGTQILTDNTANTTITITTTQKCYLDICRTQSTGTLSFSKISINSGSTALPYTPYTLQEADIDLKSKQLFNKNNSTSNYYLAQDGTPVTSNNFDYTEYIPIKPSTYYMATGFTTGTGDAPSRCYYDENKNFIIGYKHGAATDILNASPTNAYYMRESVKKVDVDTIQIYEAPYYDYGFYGKIGNYEDKFIRNSGKNLLPILKTGTKTENGITIKINEGNTITISGTATANVYFNLINDSDNVFTLEAGDYTKIASSDGNNVTGIALQLRKNDAGGEDVFGSGIQLRNVTLNEKTTIYPRLYIANGTAITTPITLFPMIAKGTYTISQINYEPYGSNEWYIKKNIGKVVLDGSESWYRVSLTTGERYYFVNDNMLQQNSTGSDILSNYFKGINYATYYSVGGVDGISYQWYNNSSRLNLFFATAFGDIDTFKTWLGNHNTIAYYQLATPTYTQITGTLANQLENVYQKMLSYSGTTNISQINNDLSFNMSVQAIEEV